MRTNERQQDLQDPKFWLQSCNESKDLFIDTKTEYGYRFTAKKPIEHGEWLIHSIP
jgi:hypothetical protein